MLPRHVLQGVDDVDPDMLFRSPEPDSNQMETVYFERPFSLGPTKGYTDLGWPFKRAPMQFMEEAALCDALSKGAF